MPTLRVSNGFVVPLPGLGRVQQFARLSQKRVTRCVRDELRRAFSPGVIVSCTASFVDGLWRGSCRIGGQSFVYSISAQ